MTTFEVINNYNIIGGFSIEIILDTYNISKVRGFGVGGETSIPCSEEEDPEAEDATRRFAAECQSRNGIQRENPLNVPVASIREEESHSLEQPIAKHNFTTRITAYNSENSDCWDGRQAPEYQRID